jgi:hypothetical protein
MLELRPEHPGFDGPGWQESLRAAGGWTEPREISVTSAQPASVDRFVDYIGSVSWVAALPADERADTLSRVRELIAAEPPEQMRVRVQIGLTSPT